MEWAVVQHLTGVRWKAIAVVSEVKPSRSHSVLLLVMVQGGYTLTPFPCRAIVSPPATYVNSSPWNRWSHMSQDIGTPRKPSQTPTKVAAYEMELGEKLCNSTL
jgi:hypothetical protein